MNGFLINKRRFIEKFIRAEYVENKAFEPYVRVKCDGSGFIFGFSIHINRI